MKLKLLALFLLVSAALIPAGAQSTTFTTKFNFPVPAIGETNWGPPLQNDMAILDQLMSGSVAGPWTLQINQPFSINGNNPSGNLFFLDLNGNGAFTGSANAPIVNASRGFQINGSYGLAGQVPVSTGSGTAFSSLSNLLHAYTGYTNSGYVLTSTGSGFSWLPGSVTLPPSAPLLGSTSAGLPQTVTLGPWFTLTGGVLGLNGVSVVGSTVVMANPLVVSGLTSTSSVTSPTLNAMIGYQLFGGYGTAGQLMVSTGTGTAFTTLPGLMNSFGGSGTSGYVLTSTGTGYSFQAPTGGSALSLPASAPLLGSTSLGAPQVVTLDSTFTLASNNLTLNGVSLSGGTETFTNPVAVPSLTDSGLTHVNVVGTNSSGLLIASSSHNLSAPANCIAASSSGSAYSCTTAPSFTPAAGDHLQFQVDIANTGSATLSVNGSAPSAFRKFGNSSALVANDLLAGNWILTTFDGTNWQVEGQLGNKSLPLAGGTMTGAITDTFGFNGPLTGNATGNTLGSSTFTNQVNFDNVMDSAPLGTNLLTGTGWVQTNESGTFGTSFVSPANTVGTLAYPLTTAASSNYILTFTIAGGNAGATIITATLGGVSGFSQNNTNGVWTFTFQSVLISSAGLTINFPISATGITVTGLSLMQRTGVSPPSVYTLDSTTSGVTYEQRMGSVASGNTFLGLGGGQDSSTVAARETSVGQLALASDFAGTNNTAIGYGALQSFHSGTNNTAIGEGAQPKATAVVQDTSVGSASLAALTVGTANTVLGYRAGSFITTGSGNTVLGASAGTPTTTGSYNIIIGTTLRGGFGPPAASTSQYMNIGNALFCQAIDESSNSPYISGTCGVDNPNPVVPWDVTGRIRTAPMTDPSAAPTVTPSTVGTTTYSYVYVALLQDGTHTAPSPVGTTTTGPASLGNSVSDPTIFNTLNWTAIPSAAKYSLYETSPSTLFLGTAPGDSTSANDFGASISYNPSVVPTVQSASSVNNSAGFMNSAPLISVGCSTSGTAVFTESDVGSSVKTISVHLAACVGTASFTFPTPFTFTPDVSGGQAALETSISTSAITVTASSSSTGWLFLRGY